MRRNRKGFTLIELIVVMIIVGVLAAIAGPLMKGNVDKAKRTEAVAALGAIRMAERCYLVEKDTYADVTDFSVDASNPLNAYIKGADIAGNYYSAANYKVGGSSATQFTAYANRTSPGNVTMNQDGVVSGF